MDLQKMRLRRLNKFFVYLVLVLLTLICLFPFIF